MYVFFSIDGNGLQFSRSAHKKFMSNKNGNSNTLKLTEWKMNGTIFEYLNKHRKMCVLCQNRGQKKK